MNISEIKDIDQVSAFLEGAQKIAFKVLGTQRERYPGFLTSPNQN